MRERRGRLWIPFELSSSGRGRQSRLRELPLFEGPGDSSGTAILPIFVPRFLLDNIQAKPKILANQGIAATAWSATPSYQQYKDANCKCYAAEMARQVRFVRHAW